MPILRDDLRFRAVGVIGSALARGLHATWRVRVHDPAGMRPAVADGSLQVIAAFWHCHLFTMLAANRGFPICLPVSQSRDGEYIAHVMERHGFVSVRGSTSRGRLDVVRGLIARARDGWTLAFTPDGPRGPRQRVQPGVALLAHRTGLPIVPMGIAVGRGLEFNSWDRFLLPLPFTTVVLAVGAIIRPGDYESARELVPALRVGLAAATATAQEMLRG